MNHLRSFPPSRAGSFLLAGLFTVGVVAACGGSNGSGFADGGGAGGSGSGGASGSGGSGGNGGFNLGDGGLGGGGVGGNPIGDAACASSTSRGQQAPLDMYIMLDQSASMSESVAGNTTKWAAVSGALDSFVTGANTAGISVGIQYFGVPPGGGAPACQVTCSTTADCGATGGPCVLGFCVGCVASSAGGLGADSCTAADYAKPDVEIAPLPGAGAAITASIAKHGPTTDTPTSAALQGAVDHSQAWAKAHPSDIVVAVLATDGDPTECDTNLTDINAIAASGVSGTPKVLTFVIGVGTSTTALNGIAAAGGTTSALLVDTTQNVNQQFLDALNKIRGTVLGCNYTIPVPSSGVPDYSQVNVEYDPGGGAATEIIPNVAAAADCPATGDAWYYDNPAAPTQIVLCPSTCKKAEANASGEVEILLGCATIAAK